MSDTKGLIILAAGGTGGHLFPAQALAEVLVGRGWTIHLMTDERVRDYGKNFPSAKTHVISSASPSIRKPHLLPGRLAKLYAGYFSAKTVMRAEKPAAVIGFGGYPSFPPLFAARAAGIPTAVHEQNAVLGRANKVLASRVDAVATSFPDVQKMPAEAKAKVVFTGNPVRAVALAQAAAPYTPPKEYGAFNLVVFGGSQGAKFFSDFMPEALAHIEPAQRRRLRLVQQCRTEDLARVRKRLFDLGVDAELDSFFNDMPQRLAAAQLVVCRSGASTIAELGVIGRPAALVPLPHAIDNDQLRNAQSFAAAGAGWVLPQAELRAPEFAGLLTKLMNDTSTLTTAAAQALGQGKPKAAEALADLTERLAHSGPKGGRKDEHETGEKNA